MSESLLQPTDPWIGKFRELVPSDDGVEVLRLDDHSAVILLRDATSKPWLLVEESSYNPMPPREHREIDETEEWPFETYGSQWFVDLDAALVSRREFHGEEGSIQGFVYAMLAILGGGRLPKDSYIQYIRHEIPSVVEGLELRGINEDIVKEIEEIIDGS